jgi:4-hydroxybenzoate polyprenyltransferase
MLVLLLGLYFAASDQLGWVYLAGVAVTAALLVYEHWLVRPDDLTRVNKAFFQVNGVISVGLFVVVLLQLAVR